MGMIRKIGLSILFLVLFFAQAVYATLLPGSSHYKGVSHYSLDGLKGYIDFAVYDTEDADGDEFAATIGDTAPGDGQYIYAYQIFCDSDSIGIVDYFEILGIGSGAISDSATDIGAVSDSPSDPGEEGVDATHRYFNPSLTKGIWEFNYGGDHILPDEHSFFLVLRSSTDWTKGTYSFTASLSDEVPIPGGGATVPEPLTFVLLGSAGLMIFNKRRK